MDLDNAIEKHATWKARLRLAISKREQLNVEELARDDCCELGQWLHGTARMQFGKLGAHAECVSKHLAFHHEVANIARKLNARQYEEAESMLGAGTAYAKISSELGVSILRLRKSVKS